MEKHLISIFCNGHLLKEEKRRRLSVTKKVFDRYEVVRKERENGCGRCTEIICDRSRSIYVLKSNSVTAKRKMTEPFCLEWAVLSALMILSGILLNPSQLDGYISTGTDPDHNNCVRDSVGIVVYQHTGIYPEKKKSGAGHADFCFKQ